MNVKEFLESRKNCPFCDTPLITSFNGGRNTIRLSDDKLVAIYTMKAMKNSQPDYRVGYSFSLKDNSFCIEFYTEWDTNNMVPKHLLDKFDSYSANRGGRHCITRKCSFCHRYVMSSNFFDLNYETCLVEDLKISFEMYAMSIPTDDGYKIITLANHPPLYSTIRWWRSQSDDVVLNTAYSFKYSEKKISTIIPFISKEETTERLNKLITFA
jgi:hypothetical protein